MTEDPTKHRRIQVTEMNGEALRLSIIFFAVLYIAFAFILYGGVFRTSFRFLAAYFAYALFSLVMVHLILWDINKSLKGRGSKHRKFLAKYVEYAYALFVSVALIQGYYALPRLADAIFPEAREAEVLKQIQTIARGHLEKECLTQDARFITSEFCEGMREIILAPDIRKHILSLIERDAKFPHQIIGGDPDLVAWIGWGDIRYSPISELVNRVEARSSYLAVSRDSFGFTWFLLFLLPIGIALRVGKTSLEIFGRLDEAPVDPTIGSGPLTGNDHR